MERKIIFATGNEGKMREIRMIMADLGLEILSMKEAGLSADVDENGTTFEENSEIKALAIKEFCEENNIDMKRVLGLDLGTNSIGWALVQHNDDLSYSLLDKGVNIFQEGVARDKSGEKPMVKGKK